MTPEQRSCLDNTFIDATDSEAVDLYKQLAFRIGIDPFTIAFKGTQVMYLGTDKKSIRTWICGRDFKKVHPHYICVGKGYLNSCIKDLKGDIPMKQESDNPVTGDLVEVITNDPERVHLGYLVGVCRDGRYAIESLDGQAIYRTCYEIKKVEPSPVEEYKTKNNLEDVDDKTIEMLLSKGLIK